MNDRPTVAELLSAARQFLESDLIPALTDARLRFQSLIAANVLAIAERELATEEAHLAEEWRSFASQRELTAPQPQCLPDLRQAVRHANARLCEQIRNGACDDPDAVRALIAQLRPSIERKLEVANPRYLASFKEPTRG